MANLVGKLPPLEASGAAVTLVHPTATTVVGEWSVTWPDDMPEEQKPDLGPTRTFGYAHRLVSNPPRFARRHVRRDVQIEAREVNGWSNAEAQMDAAGRELSGDVVFQRTLSGDDLCGLVPNVDFRQGDVVPLLVWGMVVSATCTSIRHTLVDGVPVTEVGFGPGLLVDRHGLDEEMLQIDRQMRSEAAGIHETLAKQLDEAKASSERHTKDVVERSERAVKEFVRDEDKKVVSKAETIAGETLESANRHADSAAGGALESAKRYTNNEVGGTKTYINNEISGVRSYTDGQIRQAKGYADTVAGRAIKQAQDDLETYRGLVDAKIGAQGELTKGLKKLNGEYDSQRVKVADLVQQQGALSTKLTNLSNDFSAKLGPKSDVMKAVNGQQQDSALLDAMVKGTYHRKLSGSQFQEHQNTVNRVQSSFNKRQVSVNKGFTDLFKAQDQINQVNSAFQSKQYDINSGFAALFEAQAYTNDLQLAFNKEQVGINRTYDQMWLTQAILDLTQNYAIDYNKLVADAYAPKHFELPSGSNTVQGDRGIFTVRFWSFNHFTIDKDPSRPGMTAFPEAKVYVQDGVYGFAVAELGFSRESNIYGSPRSQILSGVVRDGTIFFAAEVDGQEVTDKTKVNSVFGSFVPSVMSSAYQSRLDKLTADFNAEKKKLRAEYKRRWG